MRTYHNGDPVLGRLDDAWQTLQKLRALAEEWSEFHWELGRYYDARSDITNAVSEYRRAYELEVEPRLKTIYQAWYLLRSGQTKELRALLDVEDTLPEFGQNAIAVAQVYGMLGDLDQSFRWLEKARLSHNLPLMNIRLDPWHENIRSDPRYAELLEKLSVTS